MAKKKHYSQRHVRRIITNLVNKHGKVRVYFDDADFEPPCDCLCKKCLKDRKNNDDYQSEPDRRRRLITKDGYCSVSLKDSGYRRWTHFEESCFLDRYDHQDNSYYDDDGNYVDDYETKYSVGETLQYMFDHDQDEGWIPTHIEYGKRFKRKLKLK